MRPPSRAGAARRRTTAAGRWRAGWLAAFVVGLVAACGPSEVGNAPAPGVTLTAAPPPTAEAAPASESVPRHWEELGAHGRIVYVEAGRRIRELDLDRGVLRTLMEGREGSWTTGLSAAPDGSSFLLSYTPPPDVNGRLVSYPGLYLLSGECLTFDGGCPPENLHPVLEAPDANEVFFDGQMSPEADAAYFSSYGLDSSSGQYFYRLEFVRLADGRREILLNDGLWARPSRDGRRLVYVSAGYGMGVQNLMVAGPRGEDPSLLFSSETLPYLDSPIFHPSGEQVIFSAVGTGGASLPWWQRLAGVEVAEAHAVPSDWWQISLSGGAPTRLTEMQTSGLTGDISPDGQFLGFGASSAIYLIRLEDLGGTLALNTWAGGGLVWLP